MPERITEDLFENVITEVVGEDVLPLVKVLRKKNNVSEFKLADSVKKEINATRNMLYRLYNKNLVSFTRKKDKKKGWYIYYWTFNDSNIKHLINDLRKARLEKLQERLAQEQQGVFYSCPNKDVRLNFDQASTHFFKCPECGALLEQEDNAKRIEIISSTIAELEQEIRDAAAPKKIVEKKAKEPKKAAPPKKVKIKSAKKPKVATKKKGKK